MNRADFRENKIIAAAALAAVIFSFFLAVCARAQTEAAPNDPHTGFQSWNVWQPAIHLPTDMVMAYGADADKIKSWADRGYVVWSMFGASWLGKTEPVVLEHPEIVQKLNGGIPFEMIAGRAWVNPIAPWREYTKGMVDTVVGAGARAILPEEPEYWASTGHGEGFKTAWAEYYGEKWQNPTKSLQAQWKSNRLKAHLFTEYYRDVFSHAKSLDPTVKCLVPAHSNLNYADWNIVAPHYAFFSLPETDGFVAQVWTGTAKHAHPVGGQSRGDTFNYGFLEYGYFNELVRGTGKEAWFLADPVEDAQGAAWDDLRDWYEETVTAALMFPEINRYEVAPWPTRFMTDSGLYGGGPIPQEYATELLTVWSAQWQMPAEGTFLNGSSRAVGMLTADTLMWQRGAGRSRFNGHAAPMLGLARRGVPVRVIPAERLAESPSPAADVRILIASFDAWKPQNQNIVNSMARWIEEGGVMIFLGGTDDFNEMENSWWRADGHSSPVDVLLDRLGWDGSRHKSFEPSNALSAAYGSAPGISEIESFQKKSLQPAPDAPEAIAKMGAVGAILPLTAYGIPDTEPWLLAGNKPIVWKKNAGKGALIYAGVPGEFVAMDPAGEKLFVELVKTAAGIAGIDLPFPGSLALRRGPYVVAHAETELVELSGQFINLFRPEEPIAEKIRLEPGQNGFYLDVEKAVDVCRDKAVPCMMLASGNVSAETFDGSQFKFKIAGPGGRLGVVWLRLPDNYDGVPNISVENPDGAQASDAIRLKPTILRMNDCIKISMPLSPDGADVALGFAKK